MQWHIITGSKGGVGKTLLTLLLLEYHLERKPKEGILVLDLNATNADTSAMLQYGGRQGKRVGNPFAAGEKPRQIIVQKVFSSDENRRERYFVVGWPSNLFTLYGNDQFPQLLSGIKQLAGDIAEKAKLPTLQHVIIDTNYHFCNLFPEMDEHYKIYTEGELKNEIITVWFLWVYRQLDRFLKKETQSELMKTTAGAIERQLKKEGVGPIVHAYTPVGLLPVEPGQGGWLSKILGWDDATKMVRRDQDYPIKSLIELELLPVGKHIRFDDWMNKSQVAHNNVEMQKRKNEDAHLLFVNVLEEAVRQIPDWGEDPFLPVNIFPLSVYQSALEGYTDKDKPDIVAALRNITLYKNFAKLLDRKYESLYL